MGAVSSVNDPDPVTATWTGKRLFDSSVTSWAGFAQENALEVLASCVVDSSALSVADAGARVLMLAVDSFGLTITVIVLALLAVESLAVVVDTAALALLVSDAGARVLMPTVGSIFVSVERILVAVADIVDEAEPVIADIALVTVVVAIIALAVVFVLRAVLGMSVIAIVVAVKVVSVVVVVVAVEVVIAVFATTAVMLVAVVEVVNVVIDVALVIIAEIAMLVEVVRVALVVVAAGLRTREGVGAALLVVAAVRAIFSNAVLTTPAVWSAGMPSVDVPVDADPAVVVALVADIGVIRVRDVVGLNAPPPSACSYWSRDVSPVRLVLVVLSVPATLVLVLTILPFNTVTILLLSVVSDAVGVAAVKICLDAVFVVAETMAELIVGVTTMVAAVAFMIGLLCVMELVTLMASHPLHVLSH